MRFISFFLVVLLLSGCSFINTKALSLKVGMGKEDVSNIMGTPISRSFNGTTEAWQYANFSNTNECTYITVWFKQESLVALTNRQAPSENQSCKKGIREIDWTQIPHGL